MPLYEQIYSYLFDKIKSGEWKEGDRVPSEKELADQFDVSRITTKKALELLSNEGVITRVRGKGSFVSGQLPSGNGAKTAEKKHEAIAKGNVGKKLIGVILPDFSESYGVKMLRSIEEHCSNAGYSMIMKLSYDNQDAEEKAIRNLIMNGIDGVIVFPVHGAHYNAELLRLVLDGFPIVFVDRYLKGIAARSVYTDNRKSAMEITSVLLSAGHQHVGFISSPPENTSTLEDRFQGYGEAHSLYGIATHSEYALTDMRSTLPTAGHERQITDDRQKLMDYMDRHPEVKAFVVVEYNLALLLREVILSRGGVIPEDYEIVCFDSVDNPVDIPLFTHVRQDEGLMGRQAVHQLLTLIEGGEGDMHTIVPHQIVKGSSTGK